MKQPGAIRDAVTVLSARTSRFEHGISVLLFAVYLVVGLHLAGDYGVSWDEETSRCNAQVSAKHILQTMGRPVPAVLRDAPDLEDYRDRDYGVTFELLLLAAEHALGWSDAHNIMLGRHRLTFALFWCAAVAFYAALRVVYADWRPALAGTLFLVLHPRIFADASYNSKDMALLAFTVFSMSTLVCGLKRPGIGLAVMHGAALACALTTRVTGIGLFALSVAGQVLMVLVSSGGHRERQRRLLFASLTLVVGAILSYVLWPYLWESPLQRLTAAFANMRQFRWHGLVLYRGEFIQGNALPFHYPLVWIALTTPVPFTVLFVAGAVGVVAASLKGLRQRAMPFTDVAACLFLALAVGPVFGVIAMHAVLYDGWRHLYFIYPGIAATAADGLVRLGTFGAASTRNGIRWLRVGLWSVAISGWAVAAVALVRYHPQQQCYFNALAGGNLVQRYDIDYWGLSYRQGLEHVLARDQRSLIRVAVAHVPGVLNVAALPAAERVRLVVVPFESTDVDYYLSTFRRRGQLASFFEKRPPFDKPVFTVAVDRVTILGVFAGTNAATRTGIAR